jgi:hypothetical protein
MVDKVFFEVTDYDLNDGGDMKSAKTVIPVGFTTPCRRA